jgi:RNA polymerase sigma-70 factor (ECF subfamily)
MLPPSIESRRFEALYRAHYAAIVRFVHRRIDPASAEEIVAETFAIAWRRLDDIPPDPLPWLYVVARNLLRGERRAAAYDRDRVASAAHESSRACSRDPADAFAERDAALRAFATLSEPDREVLRLVIWEGLDHRSAARALGTSRVAFTMRSSRARRRLAAALSHLDQPSRPLGRTTPIPESQT